jgi:hypothetical protein
MAGLQIYQFLLQHNFLFDKVKKKGKVSPITKQFTMNMYIRHEGIATAIHKLNSSYTCIANLMLELFFPQEEPVDLTEQDLGGGVKLDGMMTETILFILVCKAK